MSNVLPVSEQATIQSLSEKGWSQRRIAGELGLNRRTVQRYAAKCARQVTAGSDPKRTTEVTPGSGGADRVGNGDRETRPKSRCAEFADLIAKKVDEGLSAQRIWQDLVETSGFAGSYQSVKRFVRLLKKRHPARVWRMECQPGEEMQVDFGLGAPIGQDQGGKRRSWVFRAVLSYSRKGYSEAVFRQDTETFLRCLENAIRHFGGVPVLLNLDNLKAALIKPDWYDPQLNPKLAEFCRHYGIHAAPCRPATPRHKGKIERGVGYVRNNALKGRHFKSLSEENALLLHWEQNVADKRVHGTTCKQVGALFEQERPHLQPLPATLFPCYQEARRTVHRDSYVEVQRAFYDAPPEYIGRQVWVRWDSRCVRLFNDRMEQVQIHTRIEPGKFTRHLGAGGFSAPTRSACSYWVSRAAVLGEACGQWAQSAVDARGPEALRAVMALCALIKKHSGAALNAACERALKTGARRLKDIRRLIDENAAEQNTFGFVEDHPLIRDLKIYSEFINDHHQTTNQHHEYTQTICPQSEALGAA
jgi:transposase